MKITVDSELESKRPFTFTETISLLYKEFTPVWLGLVLGLYISYLGALIMADMKESEKLLGYFKLQTATLFLLIIGVFVGGSLVYGLFKRRREPGKEIRRWWACTIERYYAIYSCVRGERPKFIATVLSSDLDEYMAQLFENDDALHIALPFWSKDIGRAAVGKYGEDEHRPKFYEVNGELSLWKFRTAKLAKSKHNDRLDVELIMEDASGVGITLSLQEAVDFIFATPFGHEKTFGEGSLSGAVKSLVFFKKMFAKKWKEEEAAKNLAHGRLHDAMVALYAAKQDAPADGIRDFLKLEMSPSDQRWKKLTSEPPSTN